MFSISSFHFSSGNGPWLIIQHLIWQLGSYYKPFFFLRQIKSCIQPLPSILSLQSPCFFFYFLRETHFSNSTYLNLVHKLCLHCFIRPNFSITSSLPVPENCQPFSVSLIQKISMADKSRILIIGGTGYIGKFIVEASVKAGHPTFVLVRESTVSDPVKGKVVENFKNLGVILVYVSI